ncbi:MAG TPA: mannanase [Bacteroidota bacterium]|nr:mannanase [Bacteroidota bacterium]
MRRQVYSFFLLALFFSSCSAPLFKSRQEDFVKVNRTHFVLDGKPYYYAGTNLWYGCYIGSPGETGDRPRLLRELDSLHAIGLDNLRILAGSEASKKLRAVRPAIVRAPGEVDDSLLMGLDYLLDEMSKRNMKAVLYLTNYWEWSGGMSEYVGWADTIRALDPEVDGWGKFMNFSATFYANERANSYFLWYVRMLVDRRNTVNGRMYSDDPTIMAWQLANEPRPGTGGADAPNVLPSYYKWIDQTAGFIKSLDTNHLVCSGNEGLAGSIGSDSCVLIAHRSKNIDYLTIHLWPLNWGWFDPQKMEETLPTSIEKATAYIAQHIEFARELHKPMVMEEFGLGRDSGAYALGTPTTARDRYYKKIFSILYDSAQAGTPVAGSNFWGWGGEGKSQNADFMWKTGDPFVGDPPQEPQGRNSIFISDRSTIAIIRDHAMKMRRLGVADSVYTPGLQ